MPHHNSTTESLLAQHGPLMTYSEVAKIFHRTSDSLKIFLYRAEAKIAAGVEPDETAIKLKNAQKKIGRRIYFRTQLVAALLED